MISERRLLEASVLLDEVRDDGEDPVVEQLYNQATRPMTILSEPPGAEIYIRDYAQQDQDWLYLATTPAQDLRIPAGHLRFKLVKEGYAPIERALDTWIGESMGFRLWPSTEAPPNMVYVDGSDTRLARGETVRVAGFWLDRFEVTNRDFQDFVDSGGYERSGLWKEPMIRHGTEVSWEDAMTEFVDKTGRPGPATWELGRFPEGYGDHPVGGVSWYEASAYAEFIGKSLPSFHHWRAAAGFDRVFSEILFLSNLGGRASVARVGAHDGLGPFGTYDMAGNVKEWNLNPSGSMRLLLGGAWQEPLYAYTQEDARDPFERLETHGFRCALYDDGDLDPSLLGDFAIELADFRQVDAVSDRDFAHFLRLYEYDRTPLDPIVQERDENSRFFIQETIHIATAYGEERLPVRLYLPRNSEPPYHAVVYFPGADARMTASFESQGLSFVDFLPRSGRALVWPIYKGHYERGGGVPAAGPVALRELYVAIGKDYRRVLDYLETRDDIDSQKMGFVGLSLGGSFGAVLSAIDDRSLANVWVAAGADVGPVLPEIDPINFAPRVNTPTILINGRYDFVDPVETSQQPFFDALGVASAHRRLHLSDSGHLPPQAAIVRESLAWLDRYLGPVQRRSHTE